VDYKKILAVVLILSLPLLVIGAKDGNPVAKTVEEEISSNYGTLAEYQMRGFMTQLTWNPQVFCVPGSSPPCEVTANVDVIAEKFFQIMVPFYVIAMLFTALFFIVRSGSPQGRQRARSMFSKLTFGAIIVVLSPAIYQAMIDLSARMVMWVLGGGSLSVNMILVDVDFGTLLPTTDWQNAPGNIIAYQGGFIGNCLFAICSASALLWASIMLYIRYFYVLYFAVFFPFIIACFSFDLTKPWGKRWLNSSIKWIFVPVLQAIIMVFVIAVSTSFAGMPPGTTSGVEPAAFEATGLETLAAALATLMIAIQGIRYLITEAPKQRKEIKKGLIYIVVGLFVVILAAEIVEQLYNIEATAVDPAAGTSFAGIFGQLASNFLAWFTIIIGLALYAFAPMFMGQVMQWFGAGVVAVGLGSGNSWMVAAGNMLQGQGASSIPSAAGEFARLRAFERMSAFTGGSGAESVTGPGYGAMGRGGAVGGGGTGGGYVAGGGGMLGGAGGGARRGSVGKAGGRTGGGGSAGRSGGGVSGGAGGGGSAGGAGGAGGGGSAGGAGAAGGAGGGTTAAGRSRTKSLDDYINEDIQQSKEAESSSAGDSYGSSGEDKYSYSETSTAREGETRSQKTTPSPQDTGSVKYGGRDEISSKRTSETVGGEAGAGRTTTGTGGAGISPEQIRQEPGAKPSDTTAQTPTTGTPTESRPEATIPSKGESYRGGGGVTAGDVGQELERLKTGGASPPGEGAETPPAGIKTTQPEGYESMAKTPASTITAERARIRATQAREKETAEEKRRFATEEDKSKRAWMSEEKKKRAINKSAEADAKKFGAQEKQKNRQTPIKTKTPKKPIKKKGGGK